MRDKQFCRESKLSGHFLSVIEIGRLEEEMRDIIVIARETRKKEGHINDQQWPPFDAHPVVFVAKQSSHACASDEEISKKNWK